ncbi:transmembrane protein 98-like isoform X1 [Haliotis rubra]|uniref:transmembrane protein 98-like isoform X1 n=1 Tax=Haliotis rubra TaxID=36100 RepID=UPI001EE62100|nr:transmembrane protein 98-like isoform X1 [Haliotis rubra]XP_046557802.1 transmembrane protein 98-like isoform X1 [Haliotis rubra]
MEIVVVVAISILATIFLASLAALVFVCRQRYCRKVDLITAQHKDTRPDVQLITSDSGPQTMTGVELDDVQITNPKIEEILKDERWVDDATGLVPHCISILKTCHQLTEKLVGMTMGNAQNIRTQETLTDIVAIAKRISPRVDEVVKSMYPPLDPRLLEARCTALVLSVSHLVLITKNACKMSGVLDWIDQSLADVEDHLRVLREASLNNEYYNPPQTEVTVTTPDIEVQMPQPEIVMQAISSNSSSQV